MKKLLILSLLITGCFGNLVGVKTSDLKLKLGTEVKVMVPYYDNCQTGLISGFLNVRLENEPIVYIVNLYCPGVGYSDMQFRETDLKVIK